MLLYLRSVLFSPLNTATSRSMFPLAGIEVGSSSVGSTVMPEFDLEGYNLAEKCQLSLGFTLSLVMNTYPPLDGK